MTVLPPLTQIPPDVVAVADYEPLARERMSPAAWAYFSGGVGDELTLQANSAA
jgi:4-hydroxymandelate oxidase